MTLGVLFVPSAIIGVNKNMPAVAMNKQACSDIKKFLSFDNKALFNYTLKTNDSSGTCHCTPTVPSVSYLSVGSIEWSGLIDKSTKIDALKSIRTCTCMKKKTHRDNTISMPTLRQRSSDE